MKKKPVLKIVVPMNERPRCIIDGCNNPGDNTGNYRVDLKFYSYKYTILAELQMGALFALPFMYTTDYRISTKTPQTGSVNAAIDSNNSNGNPNLNLTQSIRSTKGQEEITKVYKLYKAQGLIDQNLPELSFPELRNRLFRVEENINKSYSLLDYLKCIMIIFTRDPSG